MKASSMTMRFALALLFFSPLSLHAQEFGFGFGNDAEEAGVSAARTGGAFSAQLSGEAKAELTAFPDDFSGGLSETRLGDVFSGRLAFSAGGEVAEAVINLKLKPVFDGSSSPIAIDEGYLRAFFGPVSLEGGLRKLSWGKADSMGPLDVINPYDYSDMSQMSDLNSIKIARPLLHATWNIGSFTKLEGVFVPAFEGIRFANAGRWKPAQMETPLTVTMPETGTLEYMQAGLRLTTTIGSHDAGLQYYYGRLQRPAMKILFSGAVPSGIALDYNPYHQIGTDWATVLFGFNVRAELAVHLTDDFDGNKGDVYNPAVSWSFGFDRNLFLGLNLNLQCNESIRLFHSEINDNPLLDIEAGTEITSTRITAKLSRTFLRDELEIGVTGIGDIEDKGFLIMPSIIWAKDDVKTELSGGIFGGEEDGELGQYYKNSFIKLGITYTF
jgi:hypothetical protein